MTEVCMRVALNMIFMLTYNSSGCLCVLQTTLEKGELNMSLCYNDNMERLTVGVFDGKNMASDSNGSAPGMNTVICTLLTGFNFWKGLDKNPFICVGF